MTKYPDFSNCINCGHAICTQERFLKEPIWLHEQAAESIRIIPGKKGCFCGCSNPEPKLEQSVYDFNHPNIDTVYIESTNKKQYESRYTVAELKKIMEWMYDNEDKLPKRFNGTDLYEDAIYVFFEILKDNAKVQEILNGKRGVE